MTNKRATAKEQRQHTGIPQLCRAIRLHGTAWNDGLYTDDDFYINQKSDLVGEFVEVAVAVCAYEGDEEDGEVVAGVDQC